MRLTLDAFGHTWHVDIGVTCPDRDGDGEPYREAQLDALVETTGPYPDEHAELDARNRPTQQDVFGFTPRERP